MTATGADRRWWPVRDSRVRASDTDRQLVAAALQRHVGAGRLTLDEFSGRADAAYRAGTLGDLDALLEDLPGPAVLRTAPAHRPSRRALVLALVVVAVLLVYALVWAACVPAPADTVSHTVGQMMGGTGMRG